MLLIIAYVSIAEKTAEKTAESLSSRCSFKGRRSRERGERYKWSVVAQLQVRVR